MTLHLVRVADPRAFGCVPTDEDGRVTAFLEKTENPPTDQINAGCYVFRREVIEDIPAGRAVSVERETFPGLLAAGARVLGHVDSTYWLDLGTPAAFVQGSADLVRGIAPTGRAAGAGVRRCCSTAPTVDDSAVSGGSDGRRGLHGRGRRGGGRLGAVRRRGGRRGRARGAQSVLGANSLVQAGAVVSDAVIGDGAVVGARLRAVNGARVWPGVVLPEGGVRFSADV